ncbi:MAG: hypothetical protein V1909_03185 [Candidatus Micrarchaeota archaeon]
MDKPKKSNISETQKKIIDLKRFVQIGLGFYLWAMLVTWLGFKVLYGMKWISQDEWWVGLNIVGGFAVAWVLDAFVFKDNVQYSLVKDEI